MLELGPDQFGYAMAEGYAHGRAKSFRGTPSYEGGTRYRLTDLQPAYLLDVTYDWSEEQYNAWQSFFKSLDYGEDRFMTTIIMTLEPPLATVVVDRVAARLHNMWQADSAGHFRWKVTMRLELPHGTNLTLSFCDVIYGGPIGFLSSNDISAGEPDDLPPDVIAPCEAVDPQGV